MKTLADLRRYLQVGARMTMVYNASAEGSMPWERQVTDVRSRGVFFFNPEDVREKISFFEFPKAEDVDFVRDQGCWLLIVYMEDPHLGYHHHMTYQILDSWIE